MGSFVPSMSARQLHLGRCSCGWGEKEGVGKAGKRRPTHFRGACTVSPSGVATHFFLFFQTVIEFIRKQIKHGFWEQLSEKVFRSRL